MKLTRSHKSAGIVSIGSQNLNGSYTCIVLLAKINLVCSNMNFREKKYKHVDELDAKFNPMAMLNPLVCYSPQRKSLPTINGRHTVLLLRKRNKKGQYDKVTVDVFFNLKIKEAAAVFHNLTQLSMRMDPWSAFYSARIAEFKFATDIWKALQSFDFTTPIDDGPPPKQGAEVNSVDPLIEAWNAYQDNTLVSDLLTLMDSFVVDGYLRRTAGSCSFMRGLVDLLRKYNDITSDQIAKWIGQFDADHYRGIACAKATDNQKRLDRKHYREAFESSFPVRVMKAAA